MNNEDLKKLSEEIGEHLKESGISPDKIDELRKKLIKIQEKKGRELIAAEVINALVNPVDTEKILQAIKEIRIEPQITVEPTKVNIPPVKIVSREIPAPKVTVNQPSVTVKPAEVKFPKEMKVKGLGDFVKSIGRTFKEKMDVGLEAITRKNPLPVILVFNEKTYKATGGKEGGMVMGGGPSRLYLKNVDNETSQMVEEVGDPNIYNVTINAPDTEYSQALPAGTRKVKVKMRGLNVPLKFSWNSGESGTKYITIPYGSTYPMEGLKLSGKTLYFQTAKTSTPYVVEIEAWTK